METDYYIRGYLGPPRNEMTCVLKHLYSDFIVKEISVDGTLCGKVHLYFSLNLFKEKAAYCVIVKIKFSEQMLFCEQYQKLPLKHTRRPSNG